MTVTSTGDADTTDEWGHYSLPAVTGAAQSIVVSREYYETADTSMLMIGPQQLDVTITLGAYDCGNGDGISGPAGPIDVADLTYLVNYLLASGAARVCEVQRENMS